MCGGAVARHPAYGRRHETLITNGPPIENATQDAQGDVGGATAAFVLDLVEQPDDLAAPDAADRPVAKGWIDIPGESALALAQGAQLAALAGQIFPADRPQSVGG